MVETQKKIAKVVALRNCKGTSEIKKIEKDILFDLAGLSGEEFEMQFGKSSSDYQLFLLGSKLIPNNKFYAPVVANNVNTEIK